MEIGFSSSFKRAFKKKIKGHKELEEKFWRNVETFIKDPFDSALRTHKLSGKLHDLWSFRIGYDLRVVFYFAEENKVVFVDVGKHDEVY
ncbi:MAG: type II toxin-antitoxin system mRNA interferase toxin, RelE/StbE family [Nitrospirae bacterium]|nr:MAG: type II toxin-antitoxin system mRNA interferase toxin, RelE/StbE family [Nitrospirota bacterium]